MNSKLNGEVLENVILADIAQRTGHRFARLQGISVTSEAEAELILPIAAEWIDRVGLSHFRHALYSAFASQFGYQWFLQLLKWWTGETDPIAKSTLVTLILDLMRETDVPQIWKTMCVTDESYPFDCEVLSRMARTAQFGRLAKDAILRRLEDGRFIPGDLWSYAKLGDLRIQNWLIRNRNIEDPVARKVITKLLQASEALPKWLTSAKVGPPRASVLYATEVDIEHLDRELRRLGKEFHFTPPKFGRNKGFTTAADHSSWYMGLLKTKRADAPSSVWFRIEDLDVIEVVLTRSVSIPS
jgi:hypothetical protein